MSQPLRVAINAQLKPHAGSGGIESVLRALISALGKLEDGDEEYVIISSSDTARWLGDVLGPNQRITVVPAKMVSQRGIAKRMLAPLRRRVGALYRSLRTANSNPQGWTIPASDGFYEGLDCDVIHFPYQYYVLCSLPTVFNPHDLLHRHLPAMFDPAQLAWREAMYPQACRLSHTIAVASNWVKSDIIREFGIHPGKIQVIPLAPPTAAELAPRVGKDWEVRDRYGLCEGYAFYPAMLWEHKNHVRLLEAVALARDKWDARLSLVCTGAHGQGRYWEQISHTINRLRLQDQVKFIGLIPADELRSLYRLSQFVVVPTLFEAASGPVFEAWQEDVPVACSNVTSLPEQVGDAALIFDPWSAEAIGEALFRMATDSHLRERLRIQGRLRLSCFSWERTARAYRAVYRRLAQRALTDEDRYLLQWDWMRNAEEMENSSHEA
jgi:glycosyltransferase involved in cell wall biosynthesis